MENNCHNCCNMIPNNLFDLNDFSNYGSLLRSLVNSEETKPFIPFR